MPTAACVTLRRSQQEVHDTMTSHDAWTLEGVDDFFRELGSSSAEQLAAFLRSSKASSFLPHIDEDWLLDHPPVGQCAADWHEELQESLKLEKALLTEEAEFLQQIYGLLALIEETKSDGKEEYKTDVDDEDDDDDDGFGEFQSAPTETMLEEGNLPSNPPVPARKPDLMATPELLEKVDSILRNGRALTDSGETCDTRQLLQYSDRLLEEKKDENSTGTSSSAGPACPLHEDSPPAKEMRVALDLLEPSRQIVATDAPSRSEQEHRQSASETERAKSLDNASSLGESCPVSANDDGESESSGDNSSVHSRERSIPKTIEAPTVMRSPPDREERCELPVSLLLPVEDLTTLEGRFTRRRQLRETGVTESIPTVDIPASYYTSKADDTIHVLRSLRWNCLEEDPALWDELLESRLCELDSSLSAVQSQILAGIAPDEFEYANSLVHEWQLQLDLALLYHKRTAEGIHQVLEYPDESATLWEQRERGQSLQSLLQQMKEVLQQKNELLRRIEAFNTSFGPSEFNLLSQLSKELESRVSQEPLNRLLCLGDVRDVARSFLRRFWQRLLQLCQTATIRSCESGIVDHNEYRRLAAFVHEVQAASPEDGAIEYVTEWSNCIVETMRFESERALAKSLVECSINSNQLPQIRQLGEQLDLGWGDMTMVRTIGHNLVVLCFQLSDANLAEVCHNLLIRLWKVLVTHVSLLGDGDQSSGEIDCCVPDGVDFLVAVQGHLRLRRPMIWEQCEGVVVRLLTEYLHFSARPNLFENGDTAWALDLECMHRVLILVERFASLQAWFLDTVEDRPFCERKETDLYERLCDVFRRHLRNVHVEAMNSTGRLLHSDPWILDRFALPTVDGAEESSIRLVNALRIILSEARARTLAGTESRLDSQQPSPAGQPFGFSALSCVETILESEESSKEQDLLDFKFAFPRGTVDSFLEDSGDSVMLLAPRCVTEGLIPWTGRLVAIISKLRPIAEDTSAVLANLCDLYITTVFRLCSCNVHHERLLLGLKNPSPFPESSKEIRSPKTRVKSAGSPLFSSFKSTPKAGGGVSRPPMVLPSVLDAEICSPLLKDRAQVLQLGTFLQRAQRSLQDVVNLDMVDSWLSDPTRLDDSLEEHVCRSTQVLEKRQAAAWSTYLTAIVMAAGLHEAQGLVSHDRHPVADIDALACYVKTLVEVTPTMVSVSSKHAAIRAVNGRDVVLNVVNCDAEWRGSKFHEHPNELVYDLAEKCALIWGYLSLSRKLPRSILHSTWESLQSVSYLSLLEGFARISGCTTEGRALMTLDLASFASEMRPTSIVEKLDSYALGAPPPPLTTSTKLCTENVVETYVKVFYFPQEDAMKWIEQHFESYHLTHLIALVRETVQEKESIGLLERLYHLHGPSN